jgi:hypothetical protein
MPHVLRKQECNCKRLLCGGRPLWTPNDPLLPLGFPQKMDRTALRCRRQQVSARIRPEKAKAGGYASDIEPCLFGLFGVKWGFFHSTRECSLSHTVTLVRLVRDYCTRRFCTSIAQREKTISAD